MNTRRQTVWLVSMLGLMVILSAYYLFTDSNDPNPAIAEAPEANDVIVDGVGLLDPTASALAELEGLDFYEIAEQDGVENLVTEKTATNEQVLQQIGNYSGSDAITAMQIARGSEFTKQIEEMTLAITKTDASEQEIAEAINKQSALMDLEAKLIAFEEKLLSDYENVAVIYDQEQEHYIINVSAAQLERSEAVSIVTEAMHDLAIATHQVTVKLHR